MTTLTQAVDAVNALTTTVDTKIQDIDNRVAAKEAQVDAFIVDAFSSPEARANVAPGHAGDIDLKHLDSATFYPVEFSGSNSRINEFTVTRLYAEDHPADMLAGLFMKFSFTGFSWGGNPLRLLVQQQEQTYRITAGVFGMVGHTKPCVWLRGGYLYHYSSNVAASYVSVYETKRESYAGYPQTTIGPITEAAAAASPGALTAAVTTNTDMTRFLHGLGA